MDPTLLLSQDPALSRFPAILGCMLGSAIGDMMGAATEFRNSPPDGPFVKGYLQGSYGRGAYTDDTQMALAVADALLSARSPAVVEGFMAAISVEFARWRKLQDEPNGQRAPGMSCLRGASRLLAGVPWSEAGRNDGAGRGCGTVMRAHPIACAFSHNIDLCAELARRQAQATHDHPEAIQAAAIWAVAVGLALEGNYTPAGLIAELAYRFTFKPGCGQLFESIEYALAIDDGFPELQHRALGTPESWDETLDERIRLLVHRLRDVGAGWTALEAVACALVIYVLCAEDFHLAVLVAVNMHGDTDSVGAMVGALVGIRHADDLPPALLNLLENRRGITARAFGLALLQAESSAF